MRVARIDLRETSAATTRRARCVAAAMASAPEPVQRSATAAPSTPVSSRASHRSQVSLTGRCTPGMCHNLTEPHGFPTGGHLKP